MPQLPNQLPLRTDAGERIALEAKNWLHVRETGKNAGFNDAVFEDKLRAIYWQKGHAWCAYAAKMVWLEVFKQTNMEEIIREVLSGSVLVSWRNARACPYLKTSQIPVVGGIVCWGTGNGKGHTGIHVEIKDEFNTITAEGNTSRAGVREGDQFMLKHRKLQPTAKHNSDWNYLGTIIPPDYVNIIAEHTQ